MQATVYAVGWCMFVIYFLWPSILALAVLFLFDVPRWNTHRGTGTFLLGDKLHTRCPSRRGWWNGAVCVHASGHQNTSNQNCIQLLHCQCWHYSLSWTVLAQELLKTLRLLNLITFLFLVLSIFYCLQYYTPMFVDLSIYHHHHNEELIFKIKFHYMLFFADAFVWFWFRKVLIFIQNAIFYYYYYLLIGTCCQGIRSASQSYCMSG